MKLMLSPDLNGVAAADLGGALHQIDLGVARHLDRGPGRHVDDVVEIDVVSVPADDARS
jgi:hypothetical protein